VIHICCILIFRVMFRVAHISLYFQTSHEISMLNSVTHHVIYTSTSKYIDHIDLYSPWSSIGQGMRPKGQRSTIYYLYAQIMRRDPIITLSSYSDHQGLFLTTCRQSLNSTKVNNLIIVHLGIACTFVCLQLDVPSRC